MPWDMDVPLRATLPLLGVGGLTLMLSFLFCCYLYWIRRQGQTERGYKEPTIIYVATLVKYKKLKKKSAEMCPVCLEDFVVGDRLAICPCKHIFHCTCLLQWLQHSNTCPLCKRLVRRQPTEETRLVISPEAEEV